MITHKRGNKTITAFNQSDMPPRFLDVAQSLGYRIATTGGNELTHEIDATLSDVQVICELAGGILLPKPVTRNTDTVRDLMPAYQAIPCQFHDHWNPYAKLQSQWFFGGLDSKVLREKPGIDRRAALIHLQTIQEDWSPSHEHKAAAVAYLMSLWFDVVEGR